MLLASASSAVAKPSALAASSPILSAASAAKGADVSGEAKIIAREAANIRSKVAGVKSAVSQAQHTLAAAAKSQQLAAHGQKLATEEAKVLKMKRSVHAAAMLKKAAISQSLPTVAGPLATHQHGGTSTINWGPHVGPPPMPPKANADAKYEQKVTTLQAHGLFAKGPYIIMGLLASILVTFCCCAFSTRPSSMSNKYDMN